MTRLIDANELINNVRDFMKGGHFASLDFFGIRDIITKSPALFGMDEYQELASRTINYEHGQWTWLWENHALHGMVAEIGELHGIYQKAYQGHDPDQEHMKKEVGDLLWFIAEYCTAKGWKLSEVAELNIEKLMKRYPEGFDAEHSLHRDPEDV